MLTLVIIQITWYTAISIILLKQTIKRDVKSHITLILWLSFELQYNFELKFVIITKKKNKWKLLYIFSIKNILQIIHAYVNNFCHLLLKHLMDLIISFISSKLKSFFVSKSQIYKKEQLSFSALNEILFVEWNQDISQTFIHLICNL